MSKIYQKNILPFKTSAKRKFGGFTLIELLVVVLIIGILAAIALPQYQVAVGKSRAVQVFTRLNALKTGINTYYLATGEYPADVTLLDIDLFSGAKSVGDTTLSNASHIGITWEDGAQCIVRQGLAACSLPSEDIYCFSCVAKPTDGVSCDHIYCRPNPLESSSGKRLCQALGNGQKVTVNGKEYYQLP